MTNEELVTEYQKGNEKAFEELLDSTKGIRASLVRLYSQEAKSYGIDATELENELQYSLFEACRYYSFKGKFFSYAYKIAKSHIVTMIWQRRNNTYRQYYKNYVGINTISIDANYSNDDDNLQLKDIVEDCNSYESFEEIERSVDNKILKQDVNFLLNSLFDIEDREILKQLYGINCSMQSYNQIATFTGRSVDYIVKRECWMIYEIRHNELAKWFIMKYGVDFNIKRMDEIISINNPEIHILKQEQIENSFKKIMKLFERETMNLNNHYKEKYNEIVERYMKKADDKFFSYLKMTESFAKFIEDKSLNYFHRKPARFAYDEYCVWCSTNGYEPIGKKKFSWLMIEYGFDMTSASFNQKIMRIFIEK